MDGQSNIYIDIPLPSEVILSSSMKDEDDTLVKVEKSFGDIETLEFG